MLKLGWFITQHVQYVTHRTPSSDVSSSQEETAVGSSAVVRAKLLPRNQHPAIAFARHTSSPTKPHRYRAATVRLLCQDECRW